MNPKKLMLDVNPLYVFSESSSSSVGQGVHIRVIGVSDSKSLLVPVDVVKEELDDDLLSVVCRLKLAGSPLSTLGALGETDSSFTTNHPDDLWNDYYNLFFFNTGKGEYRVFSGSESRRETEAIAQLLGKSTGQPLVFRPKYNACSFKTCLSEFLLDLKSFFFCYRLSCCGLLSQQ